MKILDASKEILSSYLDNEGYELHDIEYVKEGKAWFLRVYIDNYFDLEGNNENYSPVGLDDCQKVSNYLSEKLDELDIDAKYFLEVSSPGLERSLKSDKDFKRFAGEMVSIRLYKGYEGKKNFKAVLISKDGKDIKLNIEDKDVVFSEDEIAKINLHVEF